LIKYFWIRIFDYQYIETDGPKDWLADDKGTMLDEYYLSGEELTREQAKKQVVERSSISMFAKPRKNKSGIYAIIIDSGKSWYDYFYTELAPNTICFNCHSPIQGKAKNFPCTNIGYYSDKDIDKEVHFCSYDCKYETVQKINGSEGEWQEREGYNKNGGVFGYIYHIYNRKTNKHYIGQTKYMPFFRWQEHVKSALKGDICDLVFETVCEVRKESNDYLNNIESWWIRKYIDDYGSDNVMNITVPKITIESLAAAYDQIVLGQSRLQLIEK